MIPVAHSNGLGWDEVVIMATILASIWVYRRVRGPVDHDHDQDHDHDAGGPDAPPREGAA